MKSRITTANLLLTGLNTGDFFSLEKAGRTSFQPIGTVTGIVKLQFSNDKTNFFDLLTGLDVSQPFVIETTDYFFYRFIVTTIGTGTVKWSVSNSDTVSGGGGGGGASSLTLYGLSTNDYTNTEKSKLAGIQSGAEVKVQADWSETNPASDAFIQNKPANTWEYFASNWSTEPTFNSAITNGGVYNYTLNGVTRYRFVPTTYNPTQDAFYESFDGTALTNIITKRG